MKRSASGIAFGLIANLGVVLAYVLGGKLGLMLAFDNPSATAVWPPTGISLAPLLMLGWDVVPAIFVGAFVTNLLTAGTVLTSAGIATGNTLEAILGAALVMRFADGRDAFARSRTVLAYVASVGVATMVSALIGVTTLALGHLAPWSRFGPIAFTWWLGDVVSAITLAPLLLIWIGRPRPRIRALQLVEAGFLLLLMVAIWQFVFIGWPTPFIRSRPVGYLGTPILIWAALRFGSRGAITTTAFLSAIALYGTIHGLGPFAVDTPNNSLLLLQGFIGTMTLTMLA